MSPYMTRSSVFDIGILNATDEDPVLKESKIDKDFHRVRIIVGFRITLFTHNKRIRSLMKNFIKEMICDFDESKMRLTEGLWESRYGIQDLERYGKLSKLIVETLVKLNSFFSMTVTHLEDKDLMMMIDCDIESMYEVNNTIRQCMKALKSAPESNGRCHEIPEY